MNERIIGQVLGGSKPILEVVDCGDDSYIKIRSIEEPENEIKIAKQSAHELSDLLKSVDIK